MLDNGLTHPSVNPFFVHCKCRLGKCYDTFLLVSKRLGDTLYKEAKCKKKMTANNLAVIFIYGVLFKVNYLFLPRWSGEMGGY